MRFIWRTLCVCGWIVGGLLWSTGAAGAADSRPIVGPGASKDEVLEAYGWPSGQTQAGDKEILTYPQGRIVLSKGKVETVDFSLTKPWPPPRPRPGTPGSGDSWYTSWPDALTEAQRRQVRILALFVGSDWSPPSKQFLTEVAESGEFLTAVQGNFVLLKLDYPTHAVQPKPLHTQNAELRERLEVTTYPALLILQADGALAARVDLNKPHPGDTYRAQVIAAVRETRDSVPSIAAPTGIVAPKRPVAKPAAQEVAAKSPEDAKPAAGDAEASLGLWLAGKALAWGLGGGAAFVVVFLWLFWRQSARVSAGRPSTAAERVRAAASGLPSPLDMAEWTHPQLCGVVRALAEMDGYRVSERTGGSDGDLALSRLGDERASVIVLCAPATVGAVSAKRLRELAGTVTLEEAGKGWCVAMAGFSAEARSYAQEHGVALMGKESVLDQLRALTDTDRARIMARTR